MTLSRLVVLCCATMLSIACTAPSTRTAGAPEPGSEVAAAGADSEGTPAIAATDEEDPLICETVVRTGTRVAQRSCMRRSQREIMRQNSQDAMGEVQRRGTQTGNPTGN